MAKTNQMPFKVETCLRNKKFFMMVVIVKIKMVLSLLKHINLAPKIAFRYIDDIKTFEGHQVGLEVGEWEDEAWEMEEKKINMTCTQKTTTELKKT